MRILVLTVSLIFPVLETWQTMYCQWVNVKCVEILAPALTTFFSTSSPDYDLGAYSINIIAPELVTFETHGFVPENIAIDEGSQVVSADFWNHLEHVEVELLRNVGIQVGKLLSGFSNLEELTLSDFMAEASKIEGQHYNHLKRLILFRPVNVELLFELLHAAPTLKYLSINVVIVWNEYDYQRRESVPSCIVNHLEEVETRFFRSKRPQYKLAKFLLKNGGELKKLTFSGGHTSAKRRRIVEKLSKFPRINGYTIRFSRPYSSTVLP